MGRFGQRACKLVPDATKSKTWGKIIPDCEGANGSVSGVEVGRYFAAGLEISLGLTTF